MSGDWEESFSQKHNKKFWKNKVTKATSWTDPNAAADIAGEVKPAKKTKADAAPATAAAESSAEWTEMFSKEKQKKYWKNKTTGKTTWNDPNTESAKPTATAESSNTATAAASDWTEEYSEAKQRKYWKNKTTGEKVWKDPNAAGSEAKASKASSTANSVAGDAAVATAAGGASDWEEKYSEAKKKKYWKNTKTKETSWTDPNTVAAASSAPAVAAAPAAASDWEEGYSEKHKKKFWKNKATGETSWKDPNAGTKKVAGSEVSQPAAAESTSAADEWEEGYSEKHKRKMWKNKTTGETSWKDPAKAVKKTDDMSVVSEGAVTVATATHASDWVEAYSEKHKKKYWKNTVTGKTSWTAPPADAAPTAAPASTAASEWEEGYSEKHKRKMWKNKTTGETSWKDPAKAVKKTDDMSVVSEGAVTVATATHASDWVEAYSEKHKKKYWKNTVSGKTSWTAPPMETAAEAPASSASGESDWVEGYSEKHKRKLWKNKVTGESSWKDPATLIASAAAGASTPAKATPVLTTGMRTIVRAAFTSAVAESHLTAPHQEEACRYLLQLRGKQQATDLDFLHFSEECVRASRTGVAVGVLNESSTQVLKTFKLAGLKSMVCNEVSGAISLSLPAGCLAFKVAAPVPTSALLPVAGALSMTEDTAAASIAAEPYTETAEKKETEAECYKLLLCFASPSLAQKWYKLLVQRLALTESSTVPGVGETGVVPLVCDKSGADVVSPSEADDGLLGTFSLAQSDPVLFRLESQWLGHQTAQSLVVCDQGTTGELVTLPSSGLLLFKVLVVQELSEESQLYPSSEDNSALLRMDSSSSQMKGWMSCWVRLDRAARTLTFFDQGPGSAPSLSVSCDHATLHVPDLTDPDLGCECNLYRCSVRNTPIRAEMSLAIKLPNSLELFKWIVALSSVVEHVTYCSGGKVQSATQAIDYLQDAPFQLSTVPQALSGADFAATKPYMMEICMGALEALAERKMCSSYIRNVQLSGAQIKTARFLQMNQRIVLLMKGTCSTLTEGSVLLSVNGLSTVSTAASTILKFIADFPKQMLGELTLWKFPRMEFQVEIVKLTAGVADVEEAKLTDRPNRTSDNAVSVSTVSAAVDETAKPLDSKGKLNKVIIQKRNSILKFNSGMEMSFEGVAYPSVLANIQTELKSLDLNAAPGESATTQPALEAGGFTLADFTRTAPAAVKWKHCRLMIASGNISMLVTDEHGVDVPLGRLQLTSCQMKLVCPTQGTHVDHLAIHLKDAKSQVVIRCPSVPVFIDLVECLVISLKMMGSFTADLTHLYDQSVHWKTTQERISGVTSKNATSALASSGSFRSQSLLMQSVIETTEAGGGNAATFSAPQTPQRAGEKTSDEVPMLLTATPDPDSTILQAAEDLEDTLSQLHLPLNFPTHTVIEKEMVELFKQNNANHRLLAEFLTLQFEVMNPVPEAAPAARSKSFAFAAPTAASTREEDDAHVETKYPMLSHADDAEATDTTADAAKESETALRDKLVAALGGGEEDTSEERSKESAAHVDKSDRADDAREGESKTMSPPSPKEPGSGGRRASVQMRSGSVMMGNAAPVMVQSTANRRATFRKSAITHSQEQAAVLLLSQLEKQVLLQSVLSKNDRSAISVLLNHLRNSAQDLINIATRFTSPTDVTGLAHFVVHRLCVYWSAEQRNLEDIVYAAAVAEAPHHAKSFTEAMSSAGDHSHRTGLLFTANNSLLTRLTGPANGGSFLQALLNEISNRLDVVIYVQSLCEGISVESLTQDSGVADLCARVVEPFCRRFEAAVVSGTMPIVLKFTLRALVRCETTPIKPLDFIADCILPHILSTILTKNKVAEETTGSALSPDQVQIILDRVRDMVNLCFNQDVARHLKICLSDQAALSRSKWFIERSMQYIVQDSTAPSAYSKSTPALLSPIAKLAHIETTSGKTSAIHGLICVRPSELFFILQSMELSNISAAPLSAYSRELSQAITHMHTSDLLQRLHSELRLAPITGPTTSSTAAAAVSTDAAGTGILDAMREAGIPHLDRELTFLLHVAPHSIYHNEFMHHFNDDSSVPAVNIPLPKGLSAVPGSHVGSHAGAGTSSFNSTTSSDHDLSALISSESVEESQEAHALASIRWLVQAARSALKSMYEHNNSSVAKNQSTVRELHELRAKLLARQVEIANILADWKKISVCMELCSNFKAQISLLLEKYKYIKKVSTQAAQSMVYWNSSGVSSSGGGPSSTNESAPSTVALLEASANMAAAMAAKDAEVQHALAKIVLLQLKLEGELQQVHHGVAKATTEPEFPPAGTRSASKLALLAASSPLSRTPSQSRTPGSRPSPQSNANSSSRGRADDFSAGVLRTRAPNPLHVVMQSVFASSQAASLRK